jgi:hypothetical protein
MAMALLGTGIGIFWEALTHRYRRVEARPSVSGTRPEKRLLERSSVCSRGSAPSSGGSRPEMLLFCSSLEKPKRDGSAAGSGFSDGSRSKFSFTP